MPYYHWLTFAISTFLICFAPGPNMLHMMTSAVHNGMRRTCFSMAGCFLAVSLMIGTSIAGVGALLAASPTLFNLLRYCGAAYLLYLGVQAWRNSHITIDAAHVANTSPQIPPSRLFRNGFLIGISNPKALLFAGAFFPQFIEPSAPQLQQLVILFCTFAVIEVGCYSLYALGGRQLAGLLKRSHIRKAFNRLVGTMFGAFGLLLVAKT